MAVWSGAFHKAAAKLEGADAEGGGKGMEGAAPFT